eukprot:COSAG02_NODE_59375_length_274_cov_0.885714_1_plen_30_part_10
MPVSRTQLRFRFPKVLETAAAATPAATATA